LKIMISHTQSERLFAEALNYIPGGVNSPVRAFRAVGGQPFFVNRAKGARVWDVDGNEYIDYVCTWGPAILGHAHPKIISAVKAAAEHGTSFGIPNPLEVTMAKLICSLVPAVQKVRMTNSGTEACMSAIRLARGFTGRNFVIKFEGCYHGHSDAMLVKAGSGVATLGIPGSAGVPPETAMHTLALPFNDLEAVRSAFAARPNEIACIIIEPIVGNAGTIPPAPGYLEGLRELTRELGALLILDEVMTGFRVTLGGAQRLYNIQPDLTTLGKIIGGGLPCGAFGGRADIMNHLAPLGPVYQAGTLSGNPLAMAAGIATLQHLIDNEQTIYPQLDKTTKQIAQGVAAIAREENIPLTTNQLGSMFTWFFTPNPVTDFASAATSDTQAFGKFHRAMLDQGVWLPPSQFEAAFVSAAHTKDDVAFLLNAARTALS
jgi:glutamate-1-semialdehyde 2,1-aminomutase